MSWIKEKKAPHGPSITVQIYTQPRASQSAVIGLHDGELKVKVTSPPVDGEANAELVRFFSKLLGLPRSQISVLRGQQSRHKSLLIEGCSEAQFKESVRIKS